MTDALEKYHRLGPHKGRTSCPIHGGTNMNFSYDRQKWHCFTCGAAGSDVISFVMSLFKVDFRKAVAMIDRDFGLGLAENPLSDAAAAQARAELEHRRLMRAAKDEAIKDGNTAYASTAAWYRELCLMPPKDQTNFEIRYIDHQLAKLNDWMAALAKNDKPEINDLKVPYDARAVIEASRERVKRYEDRGIG